MIADEGTEGGQNTRTLHVNIDVSHLTNLAHTGIRRAALFMGLGLNASQNSEFVDYELYKLPEADGLAAFPVDFIRANASEEQISEYKQKFGDWVVACGLREVLEHYGLMLDQMHNFCLLVAHQNDNLEEIGDPVRQQSHFYQSGLGEKLKLLQERFQVGPASPDHIRAYYKARNSLSHGFGIVRDRDTNKAQELNLNWSTIEVWAVGEETGKEVPLRSLFNQKTEEPMGVEVRPVTRSRNFKIGETLALSGQDLWEICYYFSSDCIPSIVHSFSDYLKRQGVLEPSKEER